MTELSDLYSKPEIDLTLIRRYPKQDILQHLTKFRESFGSYISDDLDLFQTDSNTPPEKPRFGMKGNRKTLTASLTNVQLSTQFKNGVPKSGLSSAIMNACIEMDKLDIVFADQMRFYCGLILSISYPYADDVSDIAQVLSNAILAKKIEDAASFGAQIGRRSGRFNRNFEVRQVQSGVIGPVSGPLFIDLEFDDRDLEKALEIKIDVNTKPTKENPDPGSFRALHEELLKAVREEGTELFGVLAGARFYE